MLFGGENICNDDLNEIEDHLPVHKITNPIWHVILASLHLSDQIKEWVTIATDVDLQQQYLQKHRLPTGINYSYQFNGTWYSKYQLYKYTEFLDSINYMLSTADLWSIDKPCPYSLELKVYPTITCFERGTGNYSAQYPVGVPINLRVLFKNNKHQPDSITRDRWQHAYTETPVTIVCCDKNVYND